MPAVKIQTGLRLDVNTYTKLKMLSIRDGRSLNNLAEHIIRQYLDNWEDTHGRLLAPEDYLPEN